MEVDIGLRLPNADHAYYRNRPGVKQPGNCVICGGWLSNENNAHKDASVGEGHRRGLSLPLRLRAALQALNDSTRAGQGWEIPRDSHGIEHDRPTFILSATHYTTGAMPRSAGFVFMRG